MSTSRRQFILSAAAAAAMAKGGKRAHAQTPTTPANPTTILPTVIATWDYGLELVQARVKGTGPGMEPPPEARLVDGWFQWKPARAPMPEVVLGNSGAAGEWRLCHDGKCRTLSEIVGHPIGANVTKMSVCKDP